MTRMFLPSLAAVVAVAFTAALSTAAHASLTYTATPGGTPTGDVYVNFDNLPLGSAGGTSNGVGVSFSPDAQVVTGSSGSFYAAPYISNSDGAAFGDSTVSGPDTTRYLTTGIGSVTLSLPAPENYVGLLWGSIDSYNTLTLYNGATLVGTITGSQAAASANGNQGPDGTFYLNINSTLAFDTVVASSSQYAFELDDVSYDGAANTGVPEPWSLGLFGLGVAGLGLGARRFRHRDVRLAA